MVTNFTIWDTISILKNIATEVHNSNENNTTTNALFGFNFCDFSIVGSTWVYQI
ncbi:hypothetical protein WNY78_15130 [Psychroserpens sp. AS72]|uniref:hypothetical protein n=1 Tax=Psychroserpens sp. AS72 TaxID=3135775 RepID=UPI0031728701